MEHETPVLARWDNDFYVHTKNTRDGGVWLCCGFVEHYFGIRPQKISLVISSRRSKECVAVDVLLSECGYVRWEPVENGVPNWYSEGTLTECLHRFVVQHLKPTTQKRRWYVTVWVYD